MNRICRLGVLLVETGVVTVSLTVLALSVSYWTVLWDMTKGGDRIAWLIPPVVVLAFWLAIREKRLSIKWFSITFHSLYVALVLAVLVLYYWIEPFPD
jgi:hypothetical protein